jgi:outer membrane protein insertion porin family
MRALEKLDIFAEIKASLQIIEDELEITYSFKEIPLVVLHPTGEYTEENGLSLGGGALSTNFLGRNHFLEGSFKTGFTKESVTRYSVEYSVPRLGNRRIRTSIWLANEEREDKLNGFQEDPYQIARLQVYPTLIYRDNYKVVSRLESAFEIEDPEPDSIAVSERGKDYIPSLGTSVWYDSRNYGGNPSNGIFLELGYFHFGGFLGGDVNYGQGLLDFRWYHSFTERQHVLFSHLLTLQSGELDEDIPIYRTFWLGGANTVRGYGLGEQQGKSQVLFTLEYRFLLLEPTAIPLFLFDWYIDIGIQPVAGIDVGTAWNDEIGDNALLNGIFLGTQVLVPYIQMMRFELSLGNMMKPGRLDMNIHWAWEEKPKVQRYRRR